jgi:hypothetical protein
LNKRYNGKYGDSISDIGGYQFANGEDDERKGNNTSRIGDKTPIRTQIVGVHYEGKKTNNENEDEKLEEFDHLMKTLHKAGAS